MQSIKSIFLSVLMLFVFAASGLSETKPYVKTAFPTAEKIKIKSGTASNYQPGGEISKSYDGDMNTIYHSSWSNTVFPVTLTYTLNSASDIDYFIYHTRTSGTNGNFMLVDVLVKKQGESTFTKVLEKDFKGATGSWKVYFDTQQKNVTDVQFVVKSGKGDNGTGFASCAEMEFYKEDDSSFNLTSIFKDKSCTSIKDGITLTQIQAIDNPFYRQLALDIFNDDYKNEFRIQDYKAWPHPDDFSRENRVGTYSLCDNPTGVYARKGDTIAVFLEKQYDIPVSLNLKDYKSADGNGYYQNSYYGLTEGVNMVVADRDGLFYVSHHSTADYKTAPDVKIHFAYGRENGYYDSEKHSDSDWIRVLNNTEYEYFDALGKYAHLSYPTAKFKQNARMNGHLLVEAYNDLVFMQREHMGYYKYPNRDPKNRSHFVVMYHSYMYSTGYHTGYHVNTMDALTRLATLKSSPWGPAHEVGHSNQTRPLFNWIGMTEVSNNVHSLLVQTNWGNTSRLIAENRYRNAFNDIIVPANPHAAADVFEKLVPFWQLQLIFTNVLGEKDFYSKIYEGARTRTVGNTHGDHQLKFVQMVCDSTGYDMTEFFETWGFLRPVDMEIDDYGVGQLRITQSDVNRTKRIIENRKYPKLPYAAEYITDENWQLYKNKAKVVKGVAARFGNNFKMSNWENVVAYEAWQGDEMVGLSMSEQVSFSGEYTEATKVYAVQYDGERIEVIADLEVPMDQPKLSDDTNEYWYIVKNMGAETTNNNSNRSFTSMRVANAGATVGAQTTPFFTTQKWKLVDVDGKVGIVNENGLYLGEDFKATTTPFGWTLDQVTQQGSSGYRFAIYNGNELTKVAHLSNALSFMNYTPADAASVWQFIPADALKASNENDENLYQITTMRTNSELIGSKLATDDNEITVESDQNKWKIVNINSTNGACNIINENGKYLGYSGANIVASDTPSNFYIYLTTFNGIVGYRLAITTGSNARMLNLGTNKNITLSNTLNDGGLWQIAKPVTTDSPSTLVDNLDVSVVNGQIFIRDIESFEVFNTSGAKVINRNLPKGVYIVKTEKGSGKVIVLN